MMRKSRFGSKAARDDSRDAAQEEKDDSTGSVDPADDENVVAEESVDRYERSSDRYRAGANERAGEGKSAPARSSFGRAAALSGALGGGKGSFGSSFSKSAKRPAAASDRDDAATGQNPVGGNTTGFGSKSRALSSKADAIASVAADGAEPVEESEFQRSSDRVFPKRASSFGRGLSKKVAAEKSAADGDDVYERSSDRKSGKGKSASRSAGGSSLRASQLSVPASGDHVFERSTERNASRQAARIAAKLAIHDEILKKASERTDSVSNVGRESAQVEPDGLSADERLERARLVLQQALTQPQSQRVEPGAPAPVVDASNLPGVTLDAPVKAHASSFDDDADPFEPFEQCAPSKDEALASPVKADPAESTYSRGTPSRQASTRKNDEAASGRKRPPLSLRGRALNYLSQREHSRIELSRKLSRFLVEGDLLEPLLDKLEQEGWLSNERFAESIVHRRGARLGASRVVHELKRNGIDPALVQDAGEALKETELTRARDVWRKKFAEPAETPAEKAKHARFLAARGFNTATIMKVLNASDEDFAAD
jgi:SOS response regulatory protein OraA/RecX